MKLNIGKWSLYAAKRSGEVRWLGTYIGRAAPQPLEIPASGSPAWLNEHQEDALESAELHLHPDERLHQAFEAADSDRLFAVLVGNCCSWGPSELYEDHETLLKLALQDDIKKFDTGWAGCKKEIVSFRIRRDQDEVICEASCSDDFDTEGSGTSVIHLLDRGGETLGFDWVEDSYERTLEALSSAWDQGVEDRKANEVYQGYSIHFLLKPEDTSGPWVETLILPKDPDYDEPPGDNYSEWGFQGETELPHALKDQIERWAWDRLNGWADGESKVFELREPIIYLNTTYSYDDTGNQTKTQTEVPVTRVMVKRWKED